MDFYGFFDGIYQGLDDDGYERYDREYQSDDLAKVMGAFYLNGIFPNQSTALTVRPGVDMQVTVQPGQGHINGRFFSLEKMKVLRIDDPDVRFSRIDRVVVRLDKSKRVVELDVKKGETSSRPNPPALTRNDNIHELCIAEVSVKPNARNLDTRDIKDTRYIRTLCGTVAHALKELDIADLRYKYENDLILYTNEYKEETEGLIDDFMDYLQRYEKDTESAYDAFIRFIEAKEKEIKDLIDQLNEMIESEDVVGEITKLIAGKQDKQMKDRVTNDKYELFFENGQLFYEEVE